jgi:hypothetical protein
MTQAARDVSRVFLDDVASVVSGTASLELDSVTSRTRPVRIVASAVPRRFGSLPVEHKQGKKAFFRLSTGATRRHEMDSGR